MTKLFALASAALLLLLTFAPLSNAAPTEQSNSRTVSSERPHHKTRKHKARKRHKKPQIAKPKTPAANQRTQSRHEFPRQRLAE